MATKSEISTTYGVRFGHPRIIKENGRGGREISRTTAIYSSTPGKYPVGSIHQVKLRDEPGFYPSKFVEGNEKTGHNWVKGPRFDELWQAVEWCL